MNCVRGSLVGVVTSALLAMVACGGSSTAPGSGAQKLTFDVNVVGSKMLPSDKLTAHGGDTITMNVTADKAEEIHLHGYDYHFAVKPGQKMSKTFTADKTGSFEIEIEESSTHLGELDVLPR
jgi:FtsP/CotA-like multicopper oxidase with cupredoxin domain